MDLDKESIEVLNTVLRNAPPISDEDVSNNRLIMKIRSLVYPNLTL